ncbi:MAG: F0F1 ATP synthase subunit gamma [Betaproteobacteria bacterium]|uniref:ATP synthase gamma chain n=1 Tax=Thiomonas delicata TaxID=364030 RepID=A0A238D1S4_THIDL|nr:MULTISPECIES: F0F1 ATP synthase subunit gamma [Thiomonas]MDE2129902.1 F0F1 ATP synthase subunit gamma [Betaproteobacteria bacterium]OZB46048.1 MAG: F0F1 ATP synthase subunit gamma [Thiomonas sp. 15-66-11]OZB66294.1 MAG: F0F1 ATP synthase subunit gamma [Thiomonas sp. 13-66-29]SBP87201.1 F1 sector of membrane-bound ATP synthase, gamma subunit [Thiomonas delicata]
MPGMKEVRAKIKSVQNTRKITKAMEMVAASKMRKAQERMRAARPYAEKVRAITTNLSRANPEYSHPFLVARSPVRGVGLILITTDKGLCGGLNTNILRAVTQHIKDWQGQGVAVQGCAIGNKGLQYLNRLGINVASQLVQMGDKPHLDKLVGPVKVLLDAYERGEIDAVYLAFSSFINTMKQQPLVEQLVPLSAKSMSTTETERKQHGWDYIYEPDAKPVIDALLVRYIEALVYQAVTENMACEQSARMVAMKSASDNAKTVISELQLVYNKSRQAAITKELSEIVGGAAAV